MARKPQKQMSTESQLALSARLAEVIRAREEEQSEPKEKHCFLISEKEGEMISSAKGRGSREFLQYVLDGPQGVVWTALGSEKKGPLALMEAIFGGLVNSGSKSPVESLLLGQMIASNQMAMSFAERSLQCSDATISTRLAEKSARFFEVFCKQAEAILRLRGDGIQQKVVVQHQYNNVAEGGQAVIASEINT